MVVGSGMEVGRRLREARLQAGLSQWELARLAGTSSCERPELGAGGADPGAASLAALASALMCLPTIY